MERFRKFSVAQREFGGPSFFRGEWYFKTAGGARGFPSYYAARKFLAGFSPFGLSEWAPSAHSVYSDSARILPSVGRAELSSPAGFCRIRRRPSAAERIFRCWRASEGEGGGRRVKRPFLRGYGFPFFHRARRVRLFKSSSHLLSHAGARGREKARTGKGGRGRVKTKYYI